MLEVHYFHPGSYGNSFGDVLGSASQWDMETLEQVLERIKELEGQVSGLEGEKKSLLDKRDELLVEIKGLKAKYSKFASFVDQDIDIKSLLDIKAKHEAGSDDLRSKYEEAYRRDKDSFEERLRSIEEERFQEKQEREREQQGTTAAKLKADAIAEFSKESYRIRNPQQFWQLFGEGKIQRGEDGKLFIGNEYKKQSLSEYITQINEDEDNAHHFRPRGGSGSGTASGTSGGGKTPENPWASATFNLTKQGQLLKQNPELAARLKAEAGMK